LQTGGYLEVGAAEHLEVPAGEEKTMSTICLAAATIMTLFIGAANAGDGGGDADPAAHWDPANDVAGPPMSSYYASQLFAPPYIAAPQSQTTA
jgi:hypothetical protein